MSRTTWFVAGAATGIYGLVRVKRVAHNLTPDGIAARAAAVQAGFRVFTSELSQGMAEREAQLRDQLALTPGGAADAVTPMMELAIERAAAPRHRREESAMMPARDGHRDGYR
jgi:hypothetical protein